MRAIPVSIDRASPVPLYHQLAEQMTAAIEAGTLNPGDPFENELAMAARLDLSRPTVRRAIAELVGRGLLVRRRGLGTRVASQVVHRRDELTSLYEDMQRRGDDPRTRVLVHDPARIDPPAAERLGLSPETPLLYLERLRSAGDAPIALMRNWLPPRYADITAADLVRTSLYSLVRQRGARPAIAHQTIGARRPLPRERRILRLRAGDPLLTMRRRVYDSEGVALESGDHSYRYDHYAFDVTVHER